MSGKRLLPFVLLGLVALAGCLQGGGGQDAVSTPRVAEVTPEQELKIHIESLAESGQMMPGMGGIGDNIEAIKATDAEKGAALEKDFEELNGVLGNPDQVKAKAKAMLEKL